MRVLLIDDEAELVSTLAERLSFRGIDADWVTDGADALKQLDKAVYDIAVVDVKMPGISGIKLKKIMAAKCPKMRFVFVTGHGSEEDFKAGSEEAGSGNYLVKPVYIEGLIKKFNEILKQ